MVLFVPDVIPPPPGFPPFSWPIAVGHVEIEQSGCLSGDGGSPDNPASQQDMEPPFSRRLCRLMMRSLSVCRTLDSWCLLWWMLVLIRGRMSVDQFLLCRPSKTSSCRICCGHRLLFHLRTSTIVASPQYLGGGWLGRVRSWRSNLLSRSVHWGLDVPSGIRHTAVRTMTRLQGSSDFLCIIRSSSGGSGFRSRPAFWRWAPVVGGRSFT